MPVGDTAWTSAYVLGSSTANNFPSNPIFNQEWIKIGDFGAGSSLERSRVHAHIKLGVTVLPGGSGSPYQEWCEGVKIDVGVYCNPLITSASPGQDADTFETDGYWLQLNTMTLIDISEWVDKAGGQHQTAVYRLIDGVSNSQSARKSGSVTYQAWLVWKIASIITWYNLDDTDYEGNGGGMMKASVLQNLLR